MASKCTTHFTFLSSVTIIIIIIVIAILYFWQLASTLNEGAESTVCLCNLATILSELLMTSEKYCSNVFNWAILLSETTRTKATVKKPQGIFGQARPHWLTINNKIINELKWGMTRQDSLILPSMPGWIKSADSLSNKRSWIWLFI